jgi:hypothetical protein
MRKGAPSSTTVVPTSAIFSVTPRMLIFADFVTGFTVLWLLLQRRLQTVPADPVPPDVGHLQRLVSLGANKLLKSVAAACWFPEHRSQVRHLLLHAALAPVRSP